MLSKTNRGFQVRIRTASKALLSYTSNEAGRNFVDSALILSRDLYKENTRINSYKKIPYEGLKPSFYRRAASEFESEYLDRKGLGNTRILEVLDVDKDFESRIAPRTEHIQQFVGDEFPLSLKEKLSILCGLSNFPLIFEQRGKNNVSKTDKISNNSTGEQLFPNLIEGEEYTTEKLRNIGKAIFDLHLGLSTIFADEKYLSLPSDSLEQTMNLFNDDREIIPLFMKRNFIYDCILPYQGTMRCGMIHSSEMNKKRKVKIQDATSIGSFYTMIGLLSVKFNKEDVLKKVVYGKIINGRTGLVSLATETLTKLRT
ncbi:uncharacterized protein AC631_01891 [Debaryomyces fabryi]|uniref:Uncharacterized protein n=1 Tax=Debaryomyces fabryi TaxID=58627 RepID=A0A0V1Q1F7_9ASCO|nr:uncharacterized protein AC631_01891 [Debaryomyces fabryi]KSA02333.1 hypothetical protein AC631_01891 [Debaryomyces fabryi]CUM51507.1 unnamed protein product [Debaryomyces fabryi]